MESEIKYLLSLSISITREGAIHLLKHIKNVREEKSRKAK